MTSHFTFTSLISSIVKWGYTIYSTGLLWGSNNMCKGLSTRLDTSLPFNNYYSLNANLHGYKQTHRKHIVLWEQIKLGDKNKKLQILISHFSLVAYKLVDNDVHKFLSQITFAYIAIYLTTQMHRVKVSGFILEKYGKLPPKLCYLKLGNQDVKGGCHGTMNKIYHLPTSSDFR